MRRAGGMMGILNPWPSFRNWRPPISLYGRTFVIADPSACGLSPQTVSGLTFPGTHCCPIWGRLPLPSQDYIKYLPLLQGTLWSIFLQVKFSAKLWTQMLTWNSNSKIRRGRQSFSKHASRSFHLPKYAVLQQVLSWTDVWISLELLMIVTEINWSLTEGLRNLGPAFELTLIHRTHREKQQIVPIEHLMSWKDHVCTIAFHIIVYLTSSISASLLMEVKRILWQLPPLGGEMAAAIPWFIAWKRKTP